MAKTANKGLLKIVEFVKKNPDFIKFPYIRTWADEVRSITVLCDPVHRLLSDFKHVTHDWGGDKPNRVNRQFLGPESVRFPFQNMTFDQMVSKFLPMFVKNSVEKNQTVWLQYADVFEMIRYGRYGMVQRDYTGGENGNGFLTSKGFIVGSKCRFFADHIQLSRNPRKRLVG